MAAALLVDNMDQSPELGLGNNSQLYVAHFADILARLDYLSKTKQQI